MQVGDPFMEKLLLEACLEAMETGAIVGIQDMGAAGLTCSTCEMGARGGVGLEIDLDRVPQRETGMTAYEIMLSESQERMLLVAEKGREEEVLRVFDKWGLDAVIVGEVIGEPRCASAITANWSPTFPTSRSPTMPRSTTGPSAPGRHPSRSIAGGSPRSAEEAARLHRRPEEAVGEREHLQQALGLRAVRLHRADQHRTGPRRRSWRDAGQKQGHADGARKQASQMALDGNGRWSYLDPKQGAKLAVAEAARKVACTGAVPVAATNCLNFGNPEKPEIMAQLTAAIDGIAEACTALERPDCPAGTSTLCRRNQG